MIDPYLRELHDEWGNAPDLLSDSDREKLETGDWLRASHECICECGKPYWKHPHVTGALWLHRLCDDLLVKF